MAEPAGPVAVVGMAALFPGAANLADYWHNIVTGTDAISDVPPGRWDPSYFDPAAGGSADRFYCRRGGFVDGLATFDPARFGIMPVTVEGTDPDQLLALTVAAQAIADAGGEQALGDRRRVGVILGRGGYIGAGLARLDQRVRTANQLVLTLRELVPGLSAAQLAGVREAFQAQLGPDRPEASIGLVPSLTASRIANRLDLQGPAYTVDAACASSLIAVNHAVTELTGGRCDAVIAGGVHHCHDVTLWSVFTQLGALSPSQRIRPFHRDADGLLIGEGTGMVVLKRLADAERDGDRVYAVIRGTGVAGDGRVTSLMNPSAGGQVMAIERAWRAAGLDPAAPGSIGLIEAHGTATPAGDETEIASVVKVFGRDGDPVTLGSVKSMIGHAMPAAGIAGLIKAALAVHHGVLPPTLHCEDPHPDLAGSRYSMPPAARDWDGPRRAGVNAFGFGGINAHVVLEEAPGRHARPAARVVERAERLLLLAAPTVDGLISQLDAQDLLTRPDTIPDGGPCRLAIVAPDERRLGLARRIAVQGKPWRGRNDIHFTAAPLLGPHAASPGRTAFLFPGLEETFAPRVADIARHFGLPEPDLSGAAAGGIGEFGVGVVTVARLLGTALARIGVTPDVMAGHSVGEWSAMIAAELYPPADVEEFLAGFDPASVEVPGVVFGALGCGADQARGAIAGLPGIVVSHDNCPHQSIVCGEEASVREALARLAAAGAGGRILPFRSGFHTPMLTPYLGAIRRNFARLRIQRPTVPIWSATTVRPYPDDPQAIRELAVRHLVEPVRFRELIRALHDDGVRVFIGVGTGSVTSFAEDTLHGLDALAIPANVPKRDGMAQLRRVGAALWAEGGSVRLGELTAPAAAPVSPGPPLDLGTPFVRLAGKLAPLESGDWAAGGRVAPASRAHPAQSPPRYASPVLAELDALVREASAAAEAVTAAWSRPPAGPPAVGTVSTVRELSAETMPYLIDHCFYQQREGWPDLADRFPVVPMTTLLEIMASAALERFPGRLVTGFRDVRALRWLAVAPPASVTIRTTPDEAGNVAVVIEGHSRGTVLLAAAYPPAPDPDTVPVTAPRPAGFGVHTLYEDRWMFHGPEFQGISALGGIGDDGITGTIRTPAAPGALLDNAGQLMGLWIMLRLDRDKLAFPSAVRELRFSGPHPAAGEELSCLVRIREVTPTEVTADVELRSAGGGVWARIEGWTDRRFAADERTWPVFRHADRNLIAEPQDGGWLLARERWPDPATRELIMRRYLTSAERAQYEAMNPRAQRQWLLGRVAVKDAVRHALGGGPLFPAELTVGNDPGGRPFVRGPFPGTMPVSLAHSGPFGAAMTGHTGIDIERVEHRGASFEDIALSPAERELLTAIGGDRDEWLTRFWAAKEAAAKAAGTGLGAPRRFTAEPAGDSVADGLLHVTSASGSWLVHTRADLAGGRPADRYVAAWTTSPADSAPLTSAHRTERATTS